jgi:hypothetical protein
MLLVLYFLVSLAWKFMTCFEEWMLIGNNVEGTQCQDILAQSQSLHPILSSIYTYASMIPAPAAMAEN